MELIQPVRVIMYNDQPLADYNPGAPIEDILKMHAATIPELATAQISGPELRHGQSVYTVDTHLGTKG